MHLCRAHSQALGALFIDRRIEASLRVILRRGYTCTQENACERKQTVHFQFLDERVFATDEKLETRAPSHRQAK